MKEQRKKGLLPLCFSLFLGFIALIWETSVTLVTAKNQHRCWKARATRVREKFRFSSPLCFLALSLRITTPLLYCPILQTTNSKTVGLRNILSLFRDFFTLWGNIYPYTYRGAPMMRAPHFISTFTAKAKLNILPPNRSLDRKSAGQAMSTIY